MIKRILFVLFIGIPLMEIFVFMVVGNWLGSIETLCLAVSTSIVGILLMRHEGYQTFQLVKIQLRNKDIPARALLEGVLVFLGGYLLIIPGFVTDIVGLLCLIPYTRSILLVFFIYWIQKRYRYP